MVLGTVGEGVCGVARWEVWSGSSGTCCQLGLISEGRTRDKKKQELPLARKEEGGEEEEEEGKEE